MALSFDNKIEYSLVIEQPEQQINVCAFRSDTNAPAELVLATYTGDELETGETEHALHFTPEQALAIRAHLNDPATLAALGVCD